MKKIVLLVLSVFPLVSMADDIRLNLVETPDQASAFYIDDPDNSGEVLGPPEAHIACLDQVLDSLAIGIVGNPEAGFRVRKGFLLFRLPSQDGKKLERAILQLFLAQIRKESSDKPLPPVWLFHASEWLDDSWDGNPRYKGLTTSLFGDKDLFKEKVPVCGQDDAARKTINIDVTAMVKKDYQRNGKPVAAFRLEISDRQKLDLADEKLNLYNFTGPSDSDLNKVPTLVLSFEN